MGIASGQAVSRLISEIDAMYEGFGDPASLRAAYADATLLVPTVSGDSIVTGNAAGTTWACAFTTEREFARFAAARADTSAAWACVRMTGAQLSRRPRSAW
jgi:hypothetical protein